MDIGRIIKNIFLFSFYTIFFLILMVFSVWFFDNFVDVPDLIFRNPDIGGTYFISFYNEENDELIAKLIYKKNIYEEPVDLSGIELLIDSNTMISVSPDIIYDDSKIKQMLIDNGYARLQTDQTSILKGEEEDEKESSVMDGDTIVPHRFVKRLHDIITSQAWDIIKWLVVTGIGISTIFSLIVKSLRSKRINVVFMGSVSSGKTTIIRRLVEPNISEAELINSSKPTEVEKVIKSRRIPVEKKDIYPSWVDNSGNDLGDMIDDVVGRGKVLFARNVGVYVLAPSTGYDASFSITKEYKIREITRALTTIKAIKKAKSIRTPAKIVLFINKMDLIYKSDDDFFKNKENAPKSFIKDEELDELIEIVDSVVVGSALKNWGINVLLKKIISK